MLVLAVKGRGIGLAHVAENAAIGAKERDCFSNEDSRSCLKLRSKFVIVSQVVRFNMFDFLTVTKITRYG